MPHIDRFSVSLDTELLAAFDTHIAARGYGNRSEAVRDMIRDLLVGSRLSANDEVVAAVLTAVCDHRETELANRLNDCLSKSDGLVVGRWHVPIDANRDRIALCMKGPADRVRSLSDRIQAMRGITHGHLSSVPAAE